MHFCLTVCEASSSDKFSCTACAELDAVGMPAQVASQILTPIELPVEMFRMQIVYCGERMSQILLNSCQCFATSRFACGTSFDLSLCLARDMKASGNVLHTSSSIDRLGNYDEQLEL